MIFLSFSEIFVVIKVGKNVPKLSVQVWRAHWSQNLRKDGKSQIENLKALENKAKSCS